MTFGCSFYTKHNYSTMNCTTVSELVLKFFINILFFYHCLCIQANVPTS